ncbi:MAG TPA: SRPBCC domain-containing protein [Galbitalea sp.]|nr:SRPBCC domain-containing protein [Galbitalea sp.]
MSTIETDLFLPNPPETVWFALTDSDLLAKWLMPNDFEPVVGHRFTFTTEPVPAQNFDGVISCEVLSMDPPRALSISWRGGTLDSTVTWHLEREGTGTRLFLTHDGFDDSDEGQLLTKRILGGGWSGKMASRLELTLATLESG